MRNCSRASTLPALLTALLLGLFLSATGTADAQEVELKKSTPASQKMYNMAAGVHNGGVYDVAAKQWEAFLEKHPDDELSPRATHYLGICYMQMKPPKYAEAVKTYDGMPAKFPKFENLADALLNLGWCQYQIGNGGDKEMLAASDKTFDDLIATGKHVDQGLYFQGESRYLRGDRQGAIESYKKLVADHAESGLRSDALYALGVAHEELGQFAEAGKVYDMFLEEFGESDQVALQLKTEIRMRKGETVLQAGVKAEEGGNAGEAKNQFAAAEKMFADAAAVEGFTSADHATYRQALCASKQGKFAEAGDLYAKVADNPDTVYLKEATLDAGRSYYQAQKWNEAAPRFQKVIETGGEEVPEAAHWLCRILIDQQKKYAEAAKLAGETISKAEGSEYLVNLKLDEADAKYEAADTRAESLELFAAIANDHAGDPLAAQAVYNAAYAALQLKNYDEAAKYAGQFLQNHADHRLAADVKYVAAESHLLKKEYAEAEKLYADLTANHKGHADVEQWQLRQGLAAYLQKKYKETVDALTPVVDAFKSKDNIAEAQYYVGSSHYRLNDFEAAATALNASYAANPKWQRSDEVLLDLARTQQKQNKLPEAIATVKKMLAEFADSGLLDRAHFQLAQYSYDNGDFKTASAEYGEVVKNWPDSIFVPHSLYGKGWGEQRTGANEAAIETFTALIDGHKDHRLTPSAHNGRGICRQRTGDFEAGIADFTAYLASEPKGQDRSDALYNRGLCEAGAKKYGDAVKTYETILKDDPQYPAADKVLYELAWAYKSQDKDAEAVPHFTKLAADFGDSSLAPEANYHVGEDLYDNEKFAEAATHYASAKSKAGKNDLGEKATYKLGWASYRQKKYDEALKAFDEQVKTYPEGSLAGDAAFMQGESNFKLENYAAALPALEKALEDESASDTVKVLSLLHAGQSAGQLEQPNWAKAVELLAKIPAEHEDSAYVPEALYELGWASFNLNKQDDALKYWTDAAAKADGALAARSRFMMGEVKFAKKDFSGAIEDYVLVVFGYGGENATDEEIKNWQAKANLQAGQASAILAGQAQDQAKRADLIKKAKGYFQRVVTKYPESNMVEAAQSQLKKLGG